MVEAQRSGLDPQLAQSLAAFEELTDLAQSDRAIAILGFAMLDDGVSRLVDAVIVPPSNSAQRGLLSGILSTAAAKIEMLFRFGFLPTLTYRDLTIMRKIRNDFAHSPTPGLTFDALATEQLGSVQKLVDFLKPVGGDVRWYEKRLGTPRGRFEAHAVLLNHHLSIIQTVATRRTPPASPVLA